MPQWEYRKIPLIEAPSGGGNIDILNDAGEEGWELVAITTDNVAYLKRQVAGPIAPAAIVTLGRKGTNNQK
jgi:hypothetical protein